MQLKLLALALAASTLAGCAMDGMNTRSDRMSTSNPMVGGAAMYASKHIIDNAVNEAGGGKAMLTTVQGGMLTARATGDGVSSKKQPSTK